MTLKLEITVTYDPASKPDEEQLRATLKRGADHLASNCMLSGATDAIVDEYSVHITRVG